jgi:hypothetical protein
MRVVTSVSILLANIAIRTAFSCRSRNKCKHHTECPAPNGSRDYAYSVSPLIRILRSVSEQGRCFLGEVKQGTQIFGVERRIET